MLILDRIDKICKQRDGNGQLTMIVPLRGEEKALKTAERKSGICRGADFPVIASPNFRSLRASPQTGVAIS